MAGLGPLQSILALYGRIRTTGASQKVGLNAPTLGPGRASAACHSRRAKRDNSQCHVRLPKIVSFPIADAFRRRKPAQCYVTS